MNATPRFLRFFLLLLLVCWGCPLKAQQLQVTGAQFASPIKDNGQKLFLYVLQPQASEETVTFSLPIEQAGQQLMAYTHSVQDARPVDNAQYQGQTVSWNTTNWDATYFLSPSVGTATYYRLFSYPRYTPSAITVTATPSTENSCQWVEISTTPALLPFLYYTPEGTQKELSREVQISYTDLSFDPTQRSFTATDSSVELQLPSSKSTSCLASLTDTEYRWGDDRFAQELGIKIAATSSPVLTAQRIEAHAYYTLSSSSEELSGGEVSAPATVEMQLVANEPTAASLTWKIIRGTQHTPTAPLVAQLQGNNTSFTFQEAGSYTIIPQVSNKQATCSTEAETLTISVSASKLEVPNAFSPHSSPGINDIFRVSHRSIVKFTATIFNEWGNQIFRWTDPDQGWDGTYHGKKMPPGVYYYIISAQGADQKEYHLKGSLHLMEGSNDTFPSQP